MNPASFFRSCRLQQPTSQLPRLVASAKSRPVQRFRQFSRSTITAVQPTTVSESSSSQSIDALPTNDDISSAQSTSSPQSPAHSTTTPISKTNASDLLPFYSSLSETDQAYARSSFRIVGKVTRTGTMKQTVAVSTNRQEFDKFLQKHYSRASSTLVHDPNDILAEGDVIEYGLFPPEQRTELVKKGKKKIKWVLRNVISPFGVAVEQRVPRAFTGVVADGETASAGAPRKKQQQQQQQSQRRAKLRA